MTHTSTSENSLRRAYRVTIALFLLAVVFVVIALSAVSQLVQTLASLNVIERERDHWQRPTDILQALTLTQGSVVIDLGCGSGYFALKLSPMVGISGRVLAVDLRRLSLFVLGIRATLRRDSNIVLIHAVPDNPHLKAGMADAALVANTYHELANPEAILNYVFLAVHPGGRLVVVDRGPRNASRESHELPLDVAAKEIRQTGFDIVSQQDRFADGPGGEPWWLIIDRRP